MSTYESKFVKCRPWKVLLWPVKIESDQASIQTFLRIQSALPATPRLLLHRHPVAAGGVFRPFRLIALPHPATVFSGQRIPAARD